MLLKYLFNYKMKYNKHMYMLFINKFYNNIKTLGDPKKCIV